MKDEKGLYYHPQPGNPMVRVYVRRCPLGGVEFRLWESEHSHVWEKHAWLSVSVIEAAAQMYKQLGRGGPQSDPMILYDCSVAEALLKEDGQ